MGFVIQTGPLLRVKGGAVSNQARTTGAKWAVSGKSRHVGVLRLSVQVRAHVFTVRPLMK